MDSIRTFQRLMRPITTRIRRMVAGGIIRMVNDAGDIQKMQIETIGRKVYDNVETFGMFGVASNPPTGLDAIIAERGGKYIVVAVGDRKYRIKNLESGDTAIYDKRGQIVLLNQSGITVNDVNGNSVVMSSAGIKMTDNNGNSITMAANGITINGAVITQAGVITTPSTITAGGDITSGTGKTMDTHTHQIAKTTAITGASTSGKTSITATTTPAI